MDMFANFLQSQYQSWREFYQLCHMVSRKLPKNDSSLPGYVQNGASLILRVRGPSQESFAHRAIDQFDRTIVFQTKPFGRVSDRDRGRIACTSYLQEELVLLRLQSCFDCGTLTKTQKSSHFEAKFSEIMNERIGNIGLTSR